MEPIVHITPENVILEGNAGEKIEQELTITPDSRHPFMIFSAESKKGKVSCDLKEIKHSEMTEYRLIVTNLIMEKEKYRDYIYLKTDSDIRPGISIRVKGDIR